MEISGKLTADIDLNDQNWEGYEMGGTIPIITGYAGTFDGEGHTISGYYYKKRRPSERPHLPVWDYLDISRKQP
ncbi:MAG: hypothetical protein V8S38_00765 [Lachnospiraceae bacterium]